MIHGFVADSSFLEGEGFGSSGGWIWSGLKAHSGFFGSLAFPFFRYGFETGFSRYSYTCFLFLSLQTPISD